MSSNDTNRSQLLLQHFLFQRGALKANFKKGKTKFRTSSRKDNVAQWARNLHLFYQRDLSTVYDLLRKKVTTEYVQDILNWYHFTKPAVHDAVIDIINTCSDVESSKTMIERVLLEDFLGYNLNDDIFIKIRLTNTFHSTVAPRLRELFDDFIFSEPVFSSEDYISRLFYELRKIMLAPDVIYRTLTHAEYTKIVNTVYFINKRTDLDLIVSTCLIEMYAEIFNFGFDQAR